MPAAETLDWLARLVSFDTTSRNSNLALIAEMEVFLAAHGVPFERVEDETLGKASLFATIGPAEEKGIVLSGHTDTVPVDGQAWTSDPFTLTARDGRLYARGTCDMKGFVATCLAMVPRMTARALKKPIHLAFSYDEEIGCLGVRPLLRRLAARGFRAEGCIVGEPTSMQVVIAHKSKYSLRTHVHGRCGHSSRAPELANAVEAGAQVAVKVHQLAARLSAEGRRDNLFDIPHSTAQVGVFHGGTALNIVPELAVLEWEVRALPDDDADAMVAEIKRYACEEILPQLQAKAPEADIRFEQTSSIPGLSTAEDAPITTLAKAWAGRNDHAKVAYGTEGGLFVDIAQIPTIVCGPGSIAQAHQADEYVEASQLEACEAFLERVIDYCA